jgi:H+/Cl- antiporter ClcA
MKMNILLGIVCFAIAQTMTWFQLNGQFLWVWFKDHSFILALFGVPISYFYIWAIQYTVEGFGGILWPSRFIGFGIGILIYSVLIYFFFNEGFQIKTLVSLILATFIIIIQIYWK